MPNKVNQAPLSQKWQNPAKNIMNRCASHLLLTVLILTWLPYSSTLSLPNGDPAPGRSPGPPVDLNGEDIGLNVDYESTTEDVETTVVSDVDDDACAFARIPSDSSEIVTLSEEDSDVNVTVTHPVFDTNELVRGVVYDAITIPTVYAHYDIFAKNTDDLFEELLGVNVHSARKQLNKRRTKFINYTEYENTTKLMNMSVSVERSTSTHKTPQLTTTASKKVKEAVNRHFLNTKLRSQVNYVLTESPVLIPDFRSDSYDPAEITRRFNEIERRRTDPHARRIYYHEYDNITEIKYVKSRYIMMMQHFIYRIRYQMPFMQMLRKQYLDSYRYKLGFCFGLRNYIRFQNRLIALPIRNGMWEKASDFALPMKIYEKLARLNVDLKDLYKLMLNLSYSAKLEDDPDYFKDFYYIFPNKTD